MCMCESNANELPSSFLFIQIRVHTYIHAGQVYLGTRKRERAYNHPRSRRRDGDFRFRITSEEEQNITREKGDGSGSVKQNWSAATCKQKKRRENATNITTLYDDNLNETYIHAHTHRIAEVKDIEMRLKTKAAKRLLTSSSSPVHHGKSYVLIDKNKSCLIIN
jgi:hypothetical protein